MKHDLRRRLTVEFVLLFVLLYFLGGAVAIFMFAAQLDRSIDNELQGLAAEVLPAVCCTSVCMLFSGSYLSRSLCLITCKCIVLKYAV